MILVASCPGGNLSNVMTYLAGGNAPLSVGMTAVSTAAAIVMTPLNLSIWGSLNKNTEPILRSVSLSPLDLFMTIFVILGIPLVVGMLIARRYPGLAEKIRGPFKTFSVVVFMGFVAVALANNWKYFVEYIGLVVFVVLLHNAVAFLIGNVAGRLARLEPRDIRAVTIEVGLQNSALALILVFNFFDGLGGMAIIAAWWGIWHIIAGLIVAGIWSRRPLEVANGMSRSVLVTGAGGYLGRQLVASLASDRDGLETVVAADLRLPDDPLPGVHYETFDIRDKSLAATLEKHGVDTVVHLAAVVSAGKNPDRALEHSIDVGGTSNVLEASLRAGVTKVIVSSSGAAYGYHADNPIPLTEDDELRGNVEFAYSDHKRQVEEMLAGWRQEHPELHQLIFRPGTILGETTRNQITDLFDRPLILGLRGAATPFVFIWDQDMVAILRRGIATDLTGIYNVCGDGVMTMSDIASELGKRYVVLPSSAVRGALWLLRRLRLTQYGPEQVDFLRYRPVLDNTRLKEQFGYTPHKTTTEAFTVFMRGRNG